MYVVIWKYEVKEAFISDFTSLYSSSGEWVRWFKESPNFIRTDLLKSPDLDNVFVTVDYWKTAESYHEFYVSDLDRRNAIDLKGERFTVHEELLGCFDRLEAN